MNRLLLILGLTFFFQATAFPHEDFAPSPLVALPDSHRPYTIDSVRNFWIQSLPKIVPPSQASRNYASNMPTYRKKLAEQNRLIARIRAGEFDGRAECLMLDHNARLADRLRQHDEAARLRERLQWLREGSARASEIDDLRMKVAEHCRTIEAMQKEIEFLKMALLKNQ